MRISEQASRGGDVTRQDGDPAAMSIGEVSRRTGVTVPTLRAWERRYGLLVPVRTAGGHRRYSDDDVRRVLAVLEVTRPSWGGGAPHRPVVGGRRADPARGRATQPGQNAAGTDAARAG